MQQLNILNTTEVTFKSDQHDKFYVAFFTTILKKCQSLEREGSYWNSHTFAGGTAK